MEMQQGSEVTADGFGVEEVGRRVVCGDDNILQKERRRWWCRCSGQSAT